MKGIKNTKVMLACIVLCLLSTPMGVNAYSSRAGEIINGIALEDSKESSGSWYSKQRSTLLASGNCYISSLGSGMLRVEGNTYCTRVCDSVSANILVQRLVGNSWITYTSKMKTAYNVASVDNYNQIIVPTGFYYRLLVNHIASKGTANEGSYTNSREVFVN